ncbi:sugar transferase [Gilvimarinus sp. F26214L]|uniref:sugar transferase n=1 Tax=Gilvimarinus sp. DZF01 TaxID=3461371 RepID=UPI004046425C
MQPLLIRSLDLCLSAVGIVCSAPLFIVISIAGLLDTGSPLFLQQRVGRDQRSFILLKFRTMAPTTQAVATHLVDADAITPLGRLLRKTKLDELPQLVNVLRGDMSLVGPRPCLPSQTRLLEERAKRGVLDVRPGITGLAQINDVDMSTPRKLARYDQVMVKNMRLSLYCKLILSTLVGRGLGDRVRGKGRNLSS